MSAFFTQKAPGRKNKENLNAKLFIQIVLILAICLGGVGKGWGQGTFFSENMGTDDGTTKLTILGNTFQNSMPILFEGTADIRNTTQSTGYTGASGGRNVFITNIIGTYFQISGINSSAYSNISLSFGQFKSTNASNNELIVEVSTDGTNFTALSYTRPTGSGTANWRLIEPTGTIPSTTNLHIRFRQTSKTIQFRIDDVKLTGLVATPCAGTPVAGSASASPTSVVSGGNVNLSLTGSTSASDLTYQWQSASSVGGPWTSISGATSSSYADNPITTTFYRCVVTCFNGGASANSTPVLVNITACVSNPTSNDGLGITSVTIGAVTFPVSDVTYYNYTGSIPNLTQGTTVISSITFATGWDYDSHIWIDLNDDNVFDNATELIYSGESTNANPTVLNTSFPLSGTANLGEHLMRIGTADNGQATPNPCYSGTYGVTIDLNVNIVAGCTPATNPQGTISVVTPVCGSTNLRYNGSDFGTAYWQTTVDDTSTLNPVTSITTDFSVNTTGTYFVRIYDGTCWSTGTVSLAVDVNSAATITSDPVNVTVNLPAGTSFSVAADGGTGYQWQYFNGVAWVDLSNNSVYSGVNTATLNISATDINMNETEYRCIVLDDSPCSNVTSNPATLFVTVGPCGNETFDNIPTSSSSTYQSRSWAGNGGTWDATNARTDQTITGEAITIRNGGSVTSPIITGGMSDLTFKTKFPFSESNGELQIKVNGILKRTILYSEMNGSNVLTFNVDNINISGDVVIEMTSYYTSGSNSRFTIDDIAWTCYTSCMPTHSVTNFNPSSGPAGTLVTISGTNFTAATSVKFGGVLATNVNFINSSTLIAEIPTNATSGPVTVIENDCPVISPIDFEYLSVNQNCGVTAGTAGLIISEVMDSRYGALSYIEIFNPTSTAISLSNYTLRISTSPTSHTDYSLGNSMLSSGSTFTVSIGANANPGEGNEPTTCSVTTSIDYDDGSGFNGNDQVILRYNNADYDVVDNPSYGQQNPSSNSDLRGFTQLRIAGNVTPRTTYVPSEWSNNDPETCDHLGIPPAAVGTSNITINSQPSDITSCNSTLNFSVDAVASPGSIHPGPGATGGYTWRYLAPGSNTWTLVSSLTSPNFTVVGSGSNSISISGAIADLQDYQFYVEISTQGSPSCSRFSNAVQYKYSTKEYYRAITSIASAGEWIDPQSWEMSDNPVSGFVPSCVYPNAYNSAGVIIPNGIGIKHTTANNIDIDKVDINFGGQLEIGTDSRLKVLNGDGAADLIVNGTLIDRAKSGYGIDLLDVNGNGNLNVDDGSWVLGPNGTIIKTNRSSAAEYRNMYYNGISNIPSTANWIYRHNGDNLLATPLSFASSTSVTPMYYPNLTLENAIPAYTLSSVPNGTDINLSDFTMIGSASPITIKGNFDVGGSGAGNVHFVNANTADQIQVLGSLIIQPGSTLTNDASPNTTVFGTGINLYGHLTANGNFINNANQNGMLSFSGTADQIISGSGTMALEDVEINNTGGAVQVRKSFSIPGTLSFGSTAARLNVDTSDITLQSNFDRTANVGIIPGTNQISYGSGRFVVERFVNTGNIDIGKSWQFLSTPTTGQTVRQSWQEDGDEPTGYGTWIVGPAGTGAGYDDQNTLTSLKSFDAGIQNWVSKDATNNALLEPRGYMVFIRGDRSAKLFSSPVTSTTLRSRGTLFAPGIYAPYTIPVSVANNFYAAGNPYASAISVTEFVNVNIGINDGIKVWDPTLNGSYGLGGYQTITKVSGNLSTPGGTLYYPSGDQKDIQSGNAFLIDAPGPASVSFTENMKVNENELLNKGPQIEQNIPMLSSMLFNAAGNIADGNRVVFDDQYTDDIDRWDARKYLNSGENFGLLRNGMSLVVEARSSVKSTDTLFYRMSNLTQGNYELRFGVQHIANPEGLQGILIDKFLQTETIIPLSDSSFVPFQTNSNAASRAADRFMLVFSKPAAPLPVRFVSIGANRVGNPAVQVHWKIELEEDMEDYGVEHSVNGISFIDIGHVAPAAASQYSFLHSQADAGQNFYRIRAISQNGLIQYSPVAAVQPLPQAPGFSVYPNPLAGSDFQLNLQDIRPGKYHLQLINDIGQTVQQQEITISSANQIIPIRLQQKLAKGVYQLLLWNGEENRRGQVVVVN